MIHNMQTCNRAMNYIEFASNRAIITSNLRACIRANNYIVFTTMYSHLFIPSCSPVLV